MSIGAGIAVVGIWGATAFMATNRQITGYGMGFALAFAVIATFIVSI